MPAETNSRRIVIAAAIVLAAAAAFWLLVLSPKKKEASELTTQVETQQQVLTEAQAKAAEAVAARKAFPTDYRHMVLLGKAVPEGDETASLIVQLQTIANRSHVSFNELLLEGGGDESEATTSIAPEAGPTSAPKPVPPTEAEAALLPLGATVGAANLGAMPYKLELVGTFNHLAHFIHGVERLIKTREQKVRVKGRLLTLDGFGVSPDEKAEFPRLEAEIKMTAYLAPPSQAATGAVAEAAPIEGEATEAAPEAAPETETTTASPSSYSTGEAR